MRISEFGKNKLRSFLNPPSTLRIPQLYSLAQQWILLAIALLILGLLYLRFYLGPPFPPPEIRDEFVIEVTGDVRKPGIYIFQTSPRLREVIERAGGMNQAVHLEGHALSEMLETGTLVTVLTPPRIKLERMAANKLLVFSIPLDLNRSSVEDLCLVPGIGDSLALEIAAHRKKRKGFRSVSELKNVKGIGEKKYRAIEKFFIVKR